MSLGGGSPPRRGCGASDWFDHYRRSFDHYGLDIENRGFGEGGGGWGFRGAETEEFLPLLRVWGLGFRFWG